VPSPGDDASLAEPGAPAPGDPSAGAPGSGSGSAVLVVVGDLVEDVIVWASERVRHGTDTAAQVFRTRGGSGANVAALAAPCVQTRFIACVGADAAGDALAATLTDAGVDVRLQRRGRTGTVVLLVDVDGERTMFPDRGAAALLGEVDPSWLDGAAWLHVPSYAFERDPMRSAVVGLIGLARERGIPVSIDASSTGLVEAIGVEDYVGLVARLSPQVLFANESEAELLGIAEGGESAAALAATIVVKHGPRPTEVFDLGELVARVPVEPVPGVRDLTGAGDAFAAGWLGAALRGAGVGEACLRGHAAAASVLGGPGTASVPVVDPG
jgi:sugar/nucleoside kinase (ribokinase family)